MAKHLWDYLQKNGYFLGKVGFLCYFCGQINTFYYFKNRYEKVFDYSCGSVHHVLIRKF